MEIGTGMVSAQLMPSTLLFFRTVTLILTYFSVTLVTYYLFLKEMLICEILNCYTTMWKRLRTTALTNRWRLVHGGRTNLRSILPHYLGHIEHLHHTLGESPNMDYGLANSRLQNFLLQNHLNCICLHDAGSTRHLEPSNQSAFVRFEVLMAWLRTVLSFGICYRIVWYNFTDVSLKHH
jgi:hypothetical protein